MGDLTDDDKDRWADQGLGLIDENISRRARLGLAGPGLASERAHIEREMAKLRAREAELTVAASRFGEEPPVGAVVTFVKRFPGAPEGGNASYTYAAIHAGPERVSGAGWFLTGRDGRQPRTWESLCDFIGDGPFRIISADAAKPLAFKAGGRAQDYVRGVLAALPDAYEQALRRAKRAAAVSDASLLMDLANHPDSDQYDNGVATPGESGYDAEKFEAATRAKRALAPFEAAESTTWMTHPAWAVYDRRHPGQPPVVEFDASRDGERRAKQSAADRNRPIRKRVLSLKEEPPIGARVRLMANRLHWGRRDANGWTRYSGEIVRAVRLSWESMRHQLGAGQQGIEPGSWNSTELFG